MSRKLAEKGVGMDKADDKKYESDIATEMWLELKAPDDKLNLWLLVGNAWLILEDAKPDIHRAVQDAFSSETLEVVVWYKRSKDSRTADDPYSPVNPPLSGSNVEYRTPIVGLVIRSK